MFNSVREALGSRQRKTPVIVATDYQGSEINHIYVHSERDSKMNYTPHRPAPYRLTTWGWLAVTEDEPIEYTLADLDGLDLQSPVDA